MLESTSAPHGSTPGILAAVTGVVLWDFDGTLAWRPGLWSGCVIEILDEHEPGHGGTVELVRERMRGVFPWHRHDEPHPHLADPDAWWASLRPGLTDAIVSCEVPPRRARHLAGKVRERFLDAERGWRAFEDSLPALAAIRAAGWRNVILSNHVPELAGLVQALGLAGLVEQVHSSGLSGFEKPHPQAFRLALEACGDPQRRWMVGDNPAADVAGAEALGIPAILIRTDATARLRAPDAAGAAALILGERRNGHTSDD